MSGTADRIEVLSIPPNDDGVDAAVRAARRLIASLLRVGDKPEAGMNAVARRLDGICDDLDGHAPDLDERMATMWAGEGVTRHDPVCGPENAVAPPLSLTGRPDGSISGEVTLDIAYQGPPGHAHGGVSAMLLDHVLGVANGWAMGPSGVTGTLTVRYHAPVPLFRSLTVTGRQDRVDGRKIRTVGTLELGGNVLVSAEGLFIAKNLSWPP